PKICFTYCKKICRTLFQLLPRLQAANLANRSAKRRMRSNTPNDIHSSNQIAVKKQATPTIFSHLEIPFHSEMRQDTEVK
ncbi:hypothetical protein IRJ41_003619, partial [Triplophysa rosa]